MGRKATVIMPATRKALEQVGENIRLARLRRRLGVALVAERASVKLENKSLKPPHRLLRMTLEVESPKMLSPLAEGIATRVSSCLSALLNALVTSRGLPGARPIS